MNVLSTSPVSDRLAVLDALWRQAVAMLDYRLASADVGGAGPEPLRDGWAYVFGTALMAYLGEVGADLPVQERDAMFGEVTAALTAESARMSATGRTSFARVAALAGIVPAGGAGRLVPHPTGPDLAEVASRLEALDALWTAACAAARYDALCQDAGREAHTGESRNAQPLGDDTSWALQSEVQSLLYVLSVHLDPGERDYVREDDLAGEIWREFKTADPGLLSFRKLAVRLGIVPPDVAEALGLVP